MLVLFLCVTMILVTSACSNVPPPTASSSATREVQRNPNMDMKPILRDFLATLPADWNLVTSQDVAKVVAVRFGCAPTG